jgi:hypothetical protein
MAHDVRVGGTTGHPAGKGPTAKLLSAYVDFEANNELADAVVSCINIPINCCVEKAWIYVEVAESTAGCTFDLGITGGTTDGFLNGVDATTVGAYWTSGCTYAAGVQSAAASVIALIPKVASAVYAKVWVYAEVVDLNPGNTA